MESHPSLFRREELHTQGFTSRRIRAALADGTLVRLRPGVYADGEAWRDATPEIRVIARARALASASASAHVFSHETSAALHGLPLYRPDSRLVHAIVPDERPGRAVGVIRHRGSLGPDDVVEIAGLPCTSLARTVADVARTMAFEQAVVIGDAALRRMFAPRVGTYDEAAARAFLERVAALAKSSAHGLTRATRVLSFVDGRAQLPGESISRIRLHQLGFRRIRLQVPVPGPRGRFFVDFALDDADAWGEFDGRIKYEGGTLSDGRSAAETYDREKQREDWIRGRTQRRLVRWGWAHIGSPRDLGARLAAFGIALPR